MFIKAIIFDYDGVLTNRGARPQQYAAAAAELGLSVEELEGRLWDTEPWQLVKRGQMSDAEFWQRVLPLIGMAPADAPYGPLAFLLQEDLDEDVVGIVRQLKGRTALALLSNATLAYEPRWVQFELLDLFDVVINSARVGLAKPDREIYELALEKLGCAPGEVLFIDDKARNTIAAEALGIPSLVFTDAVTLAHELEARGVLAPKED